MIHASWDRAGGCGEERAVGMRKCFSLVTPDIIEHSGSKLANAYNTIFNMGGPFRIVTMLSMTFPFCLVQFLPLKRTRDVAGGASNIP